MAKAVLALFSGAEQARAAIRDLAQTGVPAGEISVVTGAKAAGGLAGTSVRPFEIPGYGTIQAGGPIADVLAETRRPKGGIAEVLSWAGIPEAETRLYSEGVKRGGTLVVAEVADALADKAADILDAHDPEDPEELAARDGHEREAAAAMHVREETSRPALVPEALDGDEDHIRIIEDELQIGKRQIDRGGVVVHRDVTEFPVEEPVELAEERVEVERRPANREATEAEMRAFEPGEMEFVETVEEAVVTKRPRVVEEIVIKKTRQVRQEIVRDTVRRTDVRIEPRRK